MRSRANEKENKYIALTTLRRVCELYQIGYILTNKNRLIEKSR